MTSDINVSVLTEKEKKKLTEKSEKRLAQGEKLRARVAEARKKAVAAPPRRRKRLLRDVEKLEIRANAKHIRAKQLKERADGRINDKEWARIGKSRRNHWFYDRISAVVTAFRPRNPLRDEGMVFDRTMGGQNKHFENKGRIFLGGTKAMNRFVDEQGRDWLCKEAVTCIGTKKPMGALVTEAASRLQEALCPEAAVRSFAYRNEKGEVLGSLQERLDIPGDSFDLFKWQTDTSKPLPDGLLPQILREHVVDWLLCNFDTKGENFLIDATGTLRGIDKEQALSYLDKPETEHMSYTYSPNPNKTLYNTVFEMYAKGELALDLTAVEPYVKRVGDMSKEQYEDIFRPVVEAKCKGDPVKVREMMDKIIARKDGLAKEYEHFFETLEKDRQAARMRDTIEGKAAGRVATDGKTVEVITADKTCRRQLDLGEHLQKSKTVTPVKRQEPVRLQEKEERDITK